MNYWLCRNERGGVLTILLVCLWFVFFFVVMMAIFSYKANYLRIEVGPEEEREGVVYDKYTIAELERRENEVAQRQQELDVRQKQLTDINAQINIEKERIKQDRAMISQNLIEITNYFEQFSAEEQQNLKQLASMYESMKPDRVATIFNELKIETVAELLKRMKKREAAKVLSEIGQQNAQRAAQISNIIQGEQKNQALSEVVK